MKVLVYGYGWNGRSMLEFLEDRNEENSLRGGGRFEVFVFDENLSHFFLDKRIIRDLRDVSLESFDFIFVCIANLDNATSAKDKLLKLGIKENKIKHIQNYYYIKERYNKDDYLEKWKRSDFFNLEFNKDLEDCKQQFIDYNNYYFLRRLRHSLYNVIEAGENKKIHDKQDAISSYPVIAIAYSLGRSGTTLMSQWLASLGLFAYPPNMLKINSYTPIMNFAYYKAIEDCFKVGSTSDFTSDFGNTDGIFSELEFCLGSYLMGANLYSKFDAKNYMCSNIIVDARSYLANFSEILQKPISMKVIPQAIEFYEKICSNTLYIVLSRDIYTHVLALVNLYNSFSLPMLFYSEFNKSDVEFEKEPIKYAAITLKNAIALRERNLKNISDDRKVVISYEDFCNNPKALYDEMIEKLSKMGYSYPKEYNGVKSFDISPRRADSKTIEIVDSIFNDDRYNIDFKD